MYKIDNQIQSLRFNNGLMAVNVSELPIKVRAVRKAEHGNWKTQAIRKNFMGLNQGEEASLIKIWENFYGVWCRVKKQNGDTADISPKDLDLIT